MDRNRGASRTVAWNRSSVDPEHAFAASIEKALLLGLSLVLAFESKGFFAFSRPAGMSSSLILLVILRDAALEDFLTFWLTR